MVVNVSGYFGEVGAGRRCENESSHALSLAAIASAIRATKDFVKYDVSVGEFPTSGLFQPQRDLGSDVGKPLLMFAQEL